MKKCCILSLLVLFFCAANGQKGMSDYRRHIPFDSLFTIDLNNPNVQVNVQAAYLEIVERSAGNANILVEAKAFKNADSTTLIIVSGAGGDEQCTFYHVYAFEYSEKTDQLKQVQPSLVLPDIGIADFLKGSKAPEIISSQLPAIQRNYLGDEASLQDAIREIYSLRYSAEENSPVMKVTLNVCDYIFRNVEGVSLNSADGKIIETDFKTFKLLYDKTRKRFMLKS